MYILFAAFGACCLSASTIFSKYLAKHRVNDYASLFTATIFYMLPFVFAIPFFTKVSVNPQALLYLFFYSVTFTLGLYLFAKAVFQVDASTIGPLFQLQGGFIVILAGIFLGENYAQSTYLWLMIMIIGAMLVSINEGFNLKSFLQPGIKALLGMQLLHATSNIFVGKALESISSSSVIFYGYILNAVLVFIFWFIKKPKLIFPKKTTIIFIVRSATQFLAASSLFYAFQQNVSISSIIGLMNAPIIFAITIVTSRFKPGLLEHHSYKVYLFRGLGLAIILLSAISLALNKSL